jgi:Flp pilus assembly protein TadB
MYKSFCQEISRRDTKFGCYDNDERSWVKSVGKGSPNTGFPLVLMMMMMMMVVVVVVVMVIVVMVVVIVTILAVMVVMLVKMCIQPSCTQASIIVKH